MAGKNDIRPATKITLIDGESVEIRPVPLRKVRKLMKVIKNLDTDSGELTDENITSMCEAASIVLTGLHDSGEDLDALEDLLDLKTFNSLLTAAMGADPNE